MSDSNGKSTNLKQKIKELPQAIKVFWKTTPKGRYLNWKEILCFSEANADNIIIFSSENR